LETFEGKKLIGKYVKNPATNKKIPTLPADFVDPKNATGVVMSVPGHAPYDYVALENTKKTRSKLEEYGLTPEAIDAVEPISLIEVPGYSEIPAGDVVRKMQIQAETDPKLEEATKEVYRHEFHNGKMKQNTGKYFGLSVAEAKDKVKQDLIAEDKATTMYELLNRPIRCRCGTECIVKIFEDQWFIDYGKPEWKALAHKNLDEMEILPEEMRSEYNYVIDWLHEKACARKSGMGTRLPWDPDWIIESLSDSTIYMAYYTIVKQIKEHKIKPTQLSDEVFDYIFLGKGNPAEISKKTKLNAKNLQTMRDEFLYFYPLDSRHSAHELIPNHLTFMIFNHTAIFPEKLWPRQIVTNGHVMMEGAKMSKSFGNIIPLREGLAKFGADPIRLSVLATAELLQEADFSPSVARSMRDKLERLYNSVAEFTKAKHGKKKPAKLSAIDKWMLSRLQDHVRKATEAMDKLAVRKAVHSVLYELDQDFQWYQRRIRNERGQAKRKDAAAYVFGEIINAQARMLAPVAPHICEELWEMTGEKNFVSLSSWPKVDESKVDVKAEENEALIMGLLDDTQNIIKATGMRPKKICFYTAAPWKWKAYLKALEKSVSAKVVPSDLIRDLMKDPDLRARAKEVAEFVIKIVDEANHMSDDKRQKLTEVGAVDDTMVLKEANDFFKQELNAEIHSYNEDDSELYDPKNKARTAKPYRPAIFIE
jgi:leucyl-tRNA synthetase